MSSTGQWRGRALAVWSLALMNLVRGVLSAVGAMLPTTSSSPVALQAAVAVVSLGLAAILWSLRSGAPAWLLHLVLSISLVGTTAMVALTVTGEGAISTAVALIWLAVYAAVFLSRAAGRVYAGMAAVGLAIGLLLNPFIRSGVISWLVVVVSMIVATEVLSWFTQQLRGLAATDQLTGLPNRAGLDAVFTAAQREARRAGRPLTLAMVDLDGFKQINDESGHLAGDEILIAVADQWRKSLRSQDRVFRYGGDEFLLLLPGTSEADAHRILERLVSASAVAWSCGVTAVGPSEDIDTCISRADQRLYARKANLVREGAGISAANRAEPLRQPSLPW